MVAVEFEAFVAEQTPGLLRLAFVLTGDRHRAEDLTQSALLDAHRRWGRVAGAGSPAAYVRRMLVNAHLDWHRRRSSSEVPVDIDADRTVVDDVVETIASRDQLRTMLAGLPPRARTVLVLRYYADLDDTAIGEAMGIGASTVRATASRALATLRAQYPQLEEER